MSGIKYLLDTNFILGMLKRTPEVLEVLSAALDVGSVRVQRDYANGATWLSGDYPHRRATHPLDLDRSSTSASASRSKRLRSEYVERAAPSCLTP
jgi:hypothetical protein